MSRRENKPNALGALKNNMVPLRGLLCNKKEEKNGHEIYNIHFQEMFKNVFEIVHWKLDKNANRKKLKCGRLTLTRIIQFWYILEFSWISRILYLSMIYKKSPTGSHWDIEYLSFYYICWTSEGFLIDRNLFHKKKFPLQGRVINHKQRISY